MPKRRPSRPVTRRPLSRELVLRSAVKLADEGIESLTMRKLAERLGVEAMSLYHYVANKNELLDGIVEEVLREIELPRPDDDWKCAIRACCVSARDVFRRHPWACNLAMDPPSGSPSPSRLMFMERILETLRAGGFSPDLACHGYHALDSHIVGFSLWLRNFPATKKQLADAAADFAQQLPPDEFPYLIEHIGQHLKPSPPDKKGDFEFALDLLLDGLERTRDQTAAAH